MTERMNMLRIATPQEQKAGVFDVQRDIKATDWHMMREKMAELRTLNEPKLLVDLAACMWLLDPSGRFPELSRQIQTDVTQYLLSKHKDVQSFAPTAALMKIASPNHDTVDIAALDIVDPLGDNKNAWLRWRHEMGQYRSNNQWGDLAKAAAFLKVFAPKEKLDAYRLLVREQDYPAVTEYVDGLRERKSSDLLPCIACLKIFGYPYEMEEDVWAIGREQLQLLREEERVLDFAYYAAMMKIAASETVTVTDTGLELISPKGFIQQPHPLPATPEV